MRCLLYLATLSPTILASASCGGGQSTPDASGPDANPTAGALLGTLRVSLTAPKRETDGSTAPGTTSVLAKIYDAATPQAIIWTTADQATDCTLLTPSVPFCSTPCGGSAVCVAKDTCTPYPAAQSVGTISVNGVETESGAMFEMTPLSNTYQPAASVRLKYPGVTAASVVQMSASGSSFASSFVAVAQGVDTLMVSATSYDLAADKPLDLNWTAGATTNKVHVELDISHHGGIKGKVECVTNDDGQLVIPATMVSKLLALGAAGFPSVSLTRRSIGHAAVANGHVDLMVDSTVELPVTVPGIKSCTDDEDCVAPQTCQSDLTCK